MADLSSPPRFQGLPDIIYGTAFKFEKSTVLVEQALKAGFRAIDTAGSRSAYREALVGEALAAALASATFTRSEVYIQTKFSPFKPNKDPALYPYDVTKPIPEQVIESVQSSLVNLGVTYLDCLVLHSLYPDFEDTLLAWKAMEALVPSTVATLGVSNCDLETLHRICAAATIKPIAVQNRFTRDTVDSPTPGYPTDLPYPLIPYDRDVREYCRQHDIAYAPWGLLWGSLEVLDGPEKMVTKASERVGVSREITCYALMQSLGGCRMTLLCGTTNEGRMYETLEGLNKIKKYLEVNEENKVWWKGVLGCLRAEVDGDEATCGEK